MTMKNESMEVTNTWDKTFPLIDGVNHSKITFHNRFGITLVADRYVPQNAIGKLPAIAVCGPFGACKEQASGLYAMTMASYGYITIAFDPSFTGESGGNVRDMASGDINTEDFLAAVDYLSTQSDVDSERISIIGICGWGGLALNAAALDPRIKVTVVSTMYDMSRVSAKGYFDAADNEPSRYQMRKALAAQRTVDYQNGYYAKAGGVVDPLPTDAPDYVKDYYDYYKTSRGYHPRSGNSNTGWNVIGTQSYLNAPLLSYSNEIRNAVLIIHGEKAHSCYMGKAAYQTMIDGNPNPENKELMIIPNAVHTDLYDRVDIIPFEHIHQFIQKHLQ